MATLAEIRQQYPQYADISDQQLADALHEKFYSDMPKDQFYQQVGLRAQRRGSVDLGPPASPVEGQSFGQNFAAGMGARLAALGRGARQTASEAYELFTPFQTLVARGSGQKLRSEQLREQEAEIRERDAPLMGTGGGLAGSLATDVGLGVLGGRLLGSSGIGGQLPDRLRQATQAITPEMRAALFGFGIGGAQPLTQDENRFNMAATSAGLSQGGQVLGERIAGTLARRAAPAVDDAARQADELGASLTRTQAAADARNPMLGGAPGLSPGPNRADEAIPSWAGRVGPETTSGVTNAQRDALRRGQALGMRATPGQATGNRPLQQVEAKLESQPMTSGPFFNIKDQNQRIVTRQYLAAIGEDGDEASTVVLESARRRIGNTFDTILERNNIFVTDDLKQSIDALRAQADRELTSSQMQIIDKQLKEIASRATRDGGSISGEAYQRIRESLNRVIAGNDGSLGFWTKKLRDSLDQALEQSARPQDGPALRRARQQWQLLEIGLNRQGAINANAGVVNPRAMAAAIEQSDRFGFKLGNRQLGLYDALGFVRAFPSVVGDSGTATRSALGPIDTLAALPFRVASGVYASRPAVAAATGAQDAIRGAANQAGPVINRFGAQVGPFAPPALTGIPPFLIGQLGLLREDGQEQ